MKNFGMLIITEEIGIKKPLLQLLENKAGKILLELMDKKICSTIMINYLMMTWLANLLQLHQIMMQVQVDLLFFQIQPINFIELYKHLKMLQLEELAFHLLDPLLVPFQLWFLNMGIQTH